ncbi:MAG: flagellar assembly peptidoglycan hydrolase FlgJ [Burkholderiales bacterium]|nr:flagellar assembly peptidoglycan hydrolase FlgJ [Burkholderiales bacterium]
MIQGNNEISGRLALDAHSLDALRLQAKQNPEEALKGVSQQFEAVFLQTLLKSMREATPQDGPMDSEQTRMYTAMLDQQMAQSLSARGIGLAEVMLRQLTHNQAAAAGAPAAPPAAGAMPAPRFGPGDVDTDAPQQGQDFLMRMKEHALEASNATGIPARFLLGQAALESGWGKHEIRAADGSQSFNLFGIKAGRNWKGATVDVMTTEYVDGTPHKMTQKFRAYGSYAEGFQDYAALMQGNQRYAEVLKQRDSAGFAQGLQRAGYATDPRYADKLTSILNGARMRQTIVA